MIVTVLVLAFATAHDAVPYDVPDVRYGHAGALCSFDAFIRIHGIADPALDDVATIVRGADTGALNIATQSAGLLARAINCAARSRSASLAAHGGKSASQVALLRTWAG